MDNGLPGYLPAANRVVKFLNRLGLSLGTIEVLAVPGRRSGKMRATPVSPLTVAGHRYVIAGLISGDWAKNARAAGWGTLSRGRRTTRVTLTEVPDHDEQVRVLRAFPAKVPNGVAFFRNAGLVTGPSPDEFEQAAGKCAVFRIT
ncbi:deazaflavin-dependent nitroreductase [Fodinicola acaciae]|uniref:deazaflavin-dependent nitroreductase n=1 Tax=Fodinicola acaciae TaxID=2681555 RepID=UPI0013D3C622|nr:deazaflavin-dependent nitroreductase [Fodinicola acaciae]